MPTPRFAHMGKTNLVSAAEAAELLGVSRATLNRWAASGRISTAVEMPGQTGARLFDRGEIERAKAEQAAS